MIWGMWQSTQGVGPLSCIHETSVNKSDPLRPQVSAYSTQSIWHQHPGTRERGPVSMDIVRPPWIRLVQGCLCSRGSFEARSTFSAGVCCCGREVTLVLPHRNKYRRYQTTFLYSDVPAVIVFTCLQIKSEVLVVQVTRQRLSKSGLETKTDPK